MQVSVQIFAHKLLKSFKTFQKLGVKTLKLTAMQAVPCNLFSNSRMFARIENKL